MQQHGEQIRQIKQLLNNKSIRYRKISLSGSTVVAQSFQNSKLPKNRQIHLQIPSQNTQHQISPITVKIIEEDYFKTRNKVEGGIKSLLRVYDQAKKKNTQQLTAKLGLDVIKIKSLSSRDSSAKGIQSEIYTQRQIMNKLQEKYSNIKARLTPLKKDHERLQKNIYESSATNFYSSQKQFTNIRKSPTKTFNRQRKVEDYLYKRLEGTQNKSHQQQNSIYEKRIKSYIEFLWKVMFAHNIYNPSLQLKPQQEKPRKIKAFIGLGNNGAMVRGILKRRYWWVLSEQRTADCQFIWTQLKINQIFGRQIKGEVLKIKKIEQESDEEESCQKRKKGGYQDKYRKQLEEQEKAGNKMIMHENDAKVYQQYWKKHQISGKQRDFKYRTQNCLKELRIVKQEGIVHNHFECNYFLGNKKALFHNIREYYSLIRQNIFDYLPLTFHIRKGLKDSQYLRFVDFFKKRAKQIQRSKKQQAEQIKRRNIWIVKPGENSNQGRGITVIDEIYQLNSIIKQARSSDNQQDEKTFIVQMYLDRPLLYFNRKFDIRHYMLITNIQGVFKAYWYADGYIRTSSYEFDIQNFEEQIHLTNDAVQKRYPEYHKYEPYNKVSYEEFQRYIQSHCKKQVNFRSQILPLMKKMATDAVRSVYTKLSPRNLKNNFEIFGLDFMLDKDYKPWLIQINTNPCLECNSPLLNKIIPYMVEQSFKLSLDVIYPPPSHYPNTSKHLAPLVSLETFKYQLIFDSQFQGQALTNLYKKSRGNILQKIGLIEEDQQFNDEGKECKLEDFI